MQWLHVKYCNTIIISVFYYRASSYASAVSAVVILSVSMSVCHTHALWQNQTICTAGILIPHERVIILVFWQQRWLVGDAPLSEIALKVTHPYEKCRLRQISACSCNVSTVRERNRKLTMGFPTTHRWSAYVTHKSPKGDSESVFLFLFWM